MDRERMTRVSGEIYLKAAEAYEDHHAGRISKGQLDKIIADGNDEWEKANVQFKTRQFANKYNRGPDEMPNGWATNLDGPGAKGIVSRNVSPMDIDPDELRGMFEAAKRKQPYRCEITTKSVGGAGGFLSDVSTKTPGTPIVEGAQWPTGLFPPTVIPALSQELRYEIDRMADHIPTVTIDAPSIEFLVHSGNVNPAAVVAELGTKPDLGMQLTTATAVPIKLAALASVSTEALQDFDYFSSWVPRELSRAVTNVETQQLVLGTGSSGAYPGMTGFVNTVGKLTRAFNSATDATGLDTLIAACTDIRVGSAFGKANLIALHPSTWDGLKRSKTSTQAFVLGITDPTAIGALDNLFGVPVITNTFIPTGTGIVLDTSQAARYFVRQALTLDMNPFGDTEWTTNSVSWRCEMRSVLAVLRPTAVNVVTGLTGSWSS